MLQAAKDDDGEGDPPNNVMDWNQPEDSGGYLIIKDCPGHSDRTEDFGEKTNQDNRVVSGGIGGCEGVAESVQEDDEAQSLPEKAVGERFAESVDDGGSGGSENDEWAPD